MKRTKKVRPKLGKPKPMATYTAPAPSSPSQDLDVDAVREGSSFRKITKFAKVEGDSERQEKYEEIFGCGHHARLLTTNSVQRRKIVREIGGLIEKLAGDPDIEFARQVEHLGDVSGTEIEINLLALKKKSKVYQSHNVNSISALNFIPFPDLNCEAGYCLRVEMDSLLFGPEIRRPVNDLIRKRAGKFGRAAEPVITWLSADDTAEIDKEIAAILTPKFQHADAKQAAVKLAVDDWMKPSKAALRSLLLLQCLSMLPMEKQVSSQGQGRQWLDPALRGANLRIRALSKQFDQAIHRDGMIHFWISELKRLGLEKMAVPLIKLH